MWAPLEYFEVAQTSCCWNRWCRSRRAGGERNRGCRWHKVRLCIACVARWVRAIARCQATWSPPYHFTTEEKTVKIINASGVVRQARNCHHLTVSTPSPGLVFSVRKGPRNPTPTCSVVIIRQRTTLMNSCGGRGWSGRSGCSGRRRGCCCGFFG